MITVPTVIILGAGASKPYGYPTGKDLRLQICKESVGTKSFHEKINDGSIPPSEGIKFTKVFFKSDTRSIDLFLSRNRIFSDIGKIAIVHRILEAEKQSKFHEDIGKIYQEQNWYSYLFHRMTNELIMPDDYKKFGDNKISFITFNYDRSLEQFLYESIQNSFYESTQEKSGYDILIKQLKRIPIFHVYRCIGRLPWQGGNYEYGFEYIFQNILEMKESIGVIHEETTSEIKKMKEIIGNAKRIFFLGFGYAKENMEVLNIPRILRGQTIYGTALDLTSREIDNIYESFHKNPIYPVSTHFHEYDRVVGRWGPKINIKDMDCVSLLKKYL